MLTYPPKSASYVLPVRRYRNLFIIVFFNGIHEGFAVVVLLCYSLRSWARPSSSVPSLPRSPLTSLQLTNWLHQLASKGLYSQSSWDRSAKFTLWIILSTFSTRAHAGHTHVVNVIAGATKPLRTYYHEKFCIFKSKWGGNAIYNQTLESILINYETHKPFHFFLLG